MERYLAGRVEKGPEGSGQVIYAVVVGRGIERLNGVSVGAR
jgi:hypothetical protein